jgi:minor histocompatibility antigen H13
MSNTTLAAEVLGQIAYHLEEVSPLLPTYAHLLVSALLPIFAGAHASLTRPSSARPSPKRKAANEDEADEDEDESAPVAGLQPIDAILFPLAAGFMLVSLYYLLLWLKNPDILSKLIGGYLSIVGVLSTAQMMRDGFDVWWSLVFPQSWTDGVNIWTVSGWERKTKPQSLDTKAITVAEDQDTPLPRFLSKLWFPRRAIEALWTLRALVVERFTLSGRFFQNNFKLTFRTTDLTAILLSGFIAYYYNAIEKYWWLSNIMGFGFCYSTLQILSPTSFTTGTLVLSALFFYDIYFVFFTPVMIHVATNLDIPIKLMFPRPEADGKSALAMLGLGDILLPGMMIALALRYDLYLFYLRKQDSFNVGSHPDAAPIAKRRRISAMKEKPRYVSITRKWGERLWSKRVFLHPDVEWNPAFDQAQGSFPKVYFYASMVGYTIGMITTLIVMQIFQHGQPALLYLVPGVLISLWGTALVCGDLKLMWAFTEDDEDEKDPKVDTDKSATKPQVEKVPADAPIAKRTRSATDAPVKQSRSNANSLKPSKHSSEVFSISLKAPKALYEN